MAASALVRPPAPGLLLLYHGVGAGRGHAQRFTVAPERLEEHLAVIEEALRAGAVASATLADWWGGGARVPTVLPCFDDGGATDYEQALPRLLAHGLRATFFINTAHVGRPGYLDWGQIRALQAAGMGIESHGHEHAPLTEAAPAALERGLRTSRHMLQEHVGTAVHFLAAPYGLWNRRVLETALLCGYRALCSSRPGLAAARKQVLPRNGVRAGTSAPQLQRWLRCRHSTHLWRLGRCCLLWPSKQVLLRCRPDWPPPPPLDSVPTS